MALLMGAAEADDTVTYSRSDSYGLLGDSPFVSRWQEGLPISSGENSVQLSELTSSNAVAAADNKDAAATTAVAAWSTAGRRSVAARSSSLLRLMSWQGLSHASSSCAAAMRLWWQQQPKQQLLLVLASFVAYAVVSAALAVVPKCWGGQYAVLGVFVLLNLVLLLLATRLQWTVAPGSTAAAGEKADATGAAAVDAKQQGQQELLQGKEAAAGGGGGGAAAAAAADVTLVLDYLHSSSNHHQQQQQQREPAVETGTAALQRSDGCIPRTLLQPPHQGAEKDPHMHYPPSTSSSGLSSSSSSSNADCSQPAASTNAEELQLLQQPYDEIVWTRTLLLAMPASMFVVGLVSGLLGSSPNTLFLTPLLLELNCHPQVGSRCYSVTCMVL
jgi:hypothetical protein